MSSHLNRKGRLLALVSIAVISINLFAVLLSINPVYGAWWNNDWSYRKKITIDYTKVGENLVNFPVLVDLTDSDLASKARTDGGDIVFTDDLGNKFDHEIEFFNNSTGKLIAWIEVPSLSSTIDTVLYMYYGNPIASNQQNVAGTWDSNYVLTQHLKEASGTLYDSTTYHNDGTPAGGVSQDITGKIDGASSFDGTDDYVNCGNSASLKSIANEITLEAWIYVPELRAGWTPLIYKIGQAVQVAGFQFVVNDVGDLKFRVSTGGTWYGTNFVGKISTNSWVHAVGTYTTSDDKLRTYINGAAADTQNGPTALPSTDYNLYLASWPQLSAYGKVSLDEVRVSNVRRSDAWILTEYNNQQAPSSFFSVGTEETLLPAEEPTVSNPSPTNGAVEVSPLLSQLGFDLFDYQNDSMNYYVATYPNVGSGSGLGVSNGRYNIAVSGLQTNTTYTWQVNVTDPPGSGKWNNQTFTFKTIEALRIVSASPESRITRDRGSQQTFQISFNTLADTTWYLNGVLQQFNASLQTVSWTPKFDALGISNVTASGSDGITTAKQEWSVQVIINFSGGMRDRVRTDFAPSQPWEQGWVLDEVVWKEGNTYYMLYTGGPIGSRKIGYAWSSNGLNWTKYAGNPVLSPVPGTWDEKEVFWPSTILKIDGIYWVYYNGQDNTGKLRSGLARGNSITSLTRYEGNPQVADNYEFSCARYNETFWVGFNGYGQVNCLTSSDGLTWTYALKNILLPSGSGWDSGWINPAHTYIMNDSVYVSLTGNNKEAGVAYCRFGEWANLTRSTYNPILPIGVGWEGGLAAGLGFGVDIDGHLVVNQDDSLDAWYVGVQSLSGTGESGCGYCKLYGVNGINTAPSISNPSPINGSINVARSLSSLSFDLSDSQSDKMNYTAATAPSIGSSSGINVTDGRYFTSTTGLAYSTTYTWTVSTTDGQLWNNKTFTFTTEPKQTLNPFAEGWQYRKRITIDHTKVVGDQNDFPVLIDLLDLDLALKSQPDGDDILFMSGTGEATRLKHEIEYYNASSQHLVAWVRIPYLSSTVDTSFYLYYGNPLCTSQQDPTGVWDSNFVMVQHFKDTSGTQYDSTSYHNNGVPSGVIQGVSGKIDGADRFDGVNDYLECANVASLNPTRITLEAWIKPDTITDHRPIIEKYDWILGKGGYLIRQIDNNLIFQLAQDQNDTAPTARANGYVQIGNWYYVVGTFDGSSLKLYVNGTIASQTSWTGNVWSGDQSLKIGTRGNDKTPTSKFFNGLIDEATVSNAARSGGWVATRYNNEFAASAFYSIGAEEMSGPPGILVSPATTLAALGGDYTVYINVTNVIDLYAWEFQLNYNPAILDLTSTAIVAGGLNEPTQTFYSLTDEIAGHLWWAVSSTYPATTGISYAEHAIFRLTFHTIGVGTSNIELYGTYLSYSNSTEIIYTVVNGSVTVNAPDLTVSSITVLDLGCSIYKNDTDSPGNPYYYPVEVRITNTGNSDATSFYVKLEVYWVTGSLSEASEEIFVSSLAQGVTSTVNFTSLFHPMQTGFYRLIATVDSRNNVEESNESNNALTKENVKVTVMGDLNNDGVVDILDGVRISLAWGATPSDGWWNVKADLDHNGLVNILDATRASLHWGETA